MPQTSPNRSTGRRKPLTDATSRANAETPPLHCKNKSALLSDPLSHNESTTQPGGKLTLRYGIGDSASPLEHPRITKLANNCKYDPKRISAGSVVSNASTNASFSDPPRRRKQQVGPWQLGKTLGKGGCARVRKVRHVATGVIAVAKIVSKKVAEETRAQSLANLIEAARFEKETNAGTSLTITDDEHYIPLGLEREIVVLMLLDHRNIAKLLDVWENRNEIYMIMEYVPDGELFDFIERHGHGIPEEEVCYIFRQLIAALAYCQRLHIHHRDLKPENILFVSETRQIKICDFGMAALQPQDRWLSTPCGSPHYAAPEVLRYKHYHGGAADVWSCGVILYVMLTGRPPFNYGPNGNLKQLFSSVAAAAYAMPENLSPEAKDLIRRILVVDSFKRITLGEIWNHPFLHKYDKKWGYTERDNMLYQWIGPDPTLKQWDIRRRSDIDREILRAMRTLWHSEPEEMLIENLLNSEPTMEKYFYSAILKHRNQYDWCAPGMKYSPSDYRHYSPRDDSAEDLPGPSQSTHRAVRSESEFSIAGDEHLKPRSLASPPSAGSYDPFRASKNPLVTPPNGLMKVVVHRSGSTTSSHGRRKSGPTSSLRVSALKKSSVSSSRHGSASIRNSGVKRKSMSRTSTTSTRSNTSHHVFTAGNSMHKRGVSFSHLRRSSVGSSLTYEKTPERHQARTSREPIPRTPSVSSIPWRGDDVQPKEEESHTSLSADGRKPHHPSQIIEKEARKVSMELETFCEEAFNIRGSLSSSIHSSTTEKPNPLDYETPPSSFSNRGSDGSRYGEKNATKTTRAPREELQNRPLPPLPGERPSAYSDPELALIAEARDRLAARCAAQGGASTASRYDELIAQLNRLLEPPSASRGSEIHNRAVSAPQTRSPDYGSPLAVIPEDQSYDVEDSSYIDRTHSTSRAVTDPLARENAQISEYLRETKNLMNTIRLVRPSSPTPIAPLNIRKRGSGASGPSCNVSPGIENLSRRTSVQSSDSLGQSRYHSEVMDARFSQRVSDTIPCSHNTVTSVPNGSSLRPDHITDYQATMTQKKSWFRKKSQHTEPHPENPAIPANMSAWKKIFRRTKPDSTSHGRKIQAQANDGTTPIKEKIGSNFISRVLGFSEKGHVLVFQAPREVIKDEIIRRVQEFGAEHGGISFTNLKGTPDIYVDIDGGNVWGAKPCRILMEVFQLLVDGGPSGWSCARIRIYGFHSISKRERQTFKLALRWIQRALAMYTINDPDIIAKAYKALYN